MARSTHSSKVSFKPKANARRPGRAHSKAFRPRKRNQPQNAVELSEQFHGRPVERVTLLEQAVRERAQLAELGDMVELDIITLRGQQFALPFEGNGVRLAASPSGGQLYLVGGDQRVKLAPRGSEDTTKDKIVLGVVDEIIYYTAKALDDFVPHDYFHELGEESGARPLLIYDRLNRSLELVDGNYSTRPEGLVD